MSKDKSEILVIDDSTTDREIFKVMLKNEGYSVALAASAKEGFSTLYEKQYDLILCDYFMPEIDGEEFLKLLRKDKKLKDNTVIIITSDESKDVKVRLLKAGADDFIHKGCVYEEMIARIRTHLRANKSSKSGSSDNEKIRLELGTLDEHVDVMDKKIEALGNKKNKAELSEIISEVKKSLNKLKKLS